MAEENTQNPTTGSESDISKAQSQQQPPQQAGQQQPFRQSENEGAEQSGDQAATGQQQPGAGPDEGPQGDTLTQQRTDIEGGSLASESSGEGDSGFVGSQGRQDTSSELVDEENEDFDKGGESAPEGK